MIQFYIHTHTYMYSFFKSLSFLSMGFFWVYLNFLAAYKTFQLHFIMEVYLIYSVEPNCCIAKWLSYIHIYILFKKYPFSIMFYPRRLIQSLMLYSRPLFIPWILNFHLFQARNSYYDTLSWWAGQQATAPIRSYNHLVNNHTLTALQYPNNHSVFHLQNSIQ